MGCLQTSTVNVTRMGLIKSFGKFSGTIHQKSLYCSVYQTLKNIPGYLNDIFAALFGFTYVRNYIWKITEVTFIK